jgi:hypothetical protein
VQEGENGVERACRYGVRCLVRAHPLVADVGNRLARPSGTLEECQAEIAQVKSLLTDRTNPNYVDSFTNKKDRTGLIGKLDSASTKLSRGKTENTLTNLTSFRDKVSELAAQDKLDEADAEVLNREINDAIARVAALQAPAPTGA